MHEVFIDGERYVRAKDVAGPRVHDEQVIVLNTYEIANLRAAIEAAGYGKDCKRNPLWVLNNGDWLGQVYQKLPATLHGPNMTAKALEEAARQQCEYAAKDKGYWDS